MLIRRLPVVSAVSALAAVLLALPALPAGAHVAARGGGGGSGSGALAIGPGGGGFMVIYLARTHQVVTIDGRENCPAACTSTMFVDPATGQPLGYDDAS